jgi:hypothetical protein
VGRSPPSSNTLTNSWLLASMTSRWQPNVSLPLSSSFVARNVPWKAQIHIDPAWVAAHQIAAAAPMSTGLPSAIAVLLIHTSAHPVGGRGSVAVGIRPARTACAPRQPPSRWQAEPPAWGEVLPGRRTDGPNTLSRVEVPARRR